MRKIEEQMIDAISCGKGWRKDNTQVIVDRSAYSSHITSIYLHGNLICTIYDFPHRREISINSCGWQTPTTKSRLNAILNHYDLTGIHQSKGIWYRGKHEFIGSELIKC